MKNQVQTQQQVNLFKVLELGDRKISRAKDEAIMIIGLTRGGKSCLYNYILGKPMIGQVDPIDPQKVIYVQDGDGKHVDGGFARMSSTFQSVTLQPNLDMIQVDGRQITLIDMAGFVDNRDEVEIIAVSYFLVSCYQKLKRIKFIIVLTENKLYNQNIDPLNKTFENFADLFKLDIFPLKMRQDLIRSISLVITCAKYSSQNHKQKVLTIIRRLQTQSSLRLKYKDLIIEILENVLRFERLQLFEQAREEQAAEQCQIVNRINSKGWDYFDADKAKEQLKRKIFISAFQKDYNNLDKYQQGRLYKILQDKAETFKEQIRLIFSLPFTNLTENWNHLINKASEESNFCQKLKQILPYQTINKFLAQMYVYDQDPNTEEQNLEKFMKHKNSSFSSILLAINQLYNLRFKLEQLRKEYVNLEVKSKAQNQISEAQTLQKQLRQLCKLLKDMLTCLISFCQSQEDLKKLGKMSFVIDRFFIQFSKFNELTPELVNNVKINIYDRMNQTFTFTRFQYLRQFIHKFNQQNLKKRVLNLEQLNQYETIISIYKDSISQSQQESKQLQVSQEQKRSFSFEFSQHKLDIQLRKYELYLTQNNNILVIKTLINMVNLYFQHDVLISQLVSQQTSSNQEQKSYLKQMSACKKLIKCFQKLERDNYPKHLQLALQLSELTRSSYQQDRLFKALLDQKAHSYEQEEKLLERYISYCKQWGKVNKIKDLLLRKLSLAQENEDLVKIQAIEEELKRLGTEHQSINEKYQNKLKAMGQPFSQKEKVGLISLFQKIKKVF